LCGSILLYKLLYYAAMYIVDGIECSAENCNIHVIRIKKKPDDFHRAYKIESQESIKNY
jgi:hypothetical protein